MTSDRGEEIANNLLRSLRPHDLELLRPHLTPIQVKSGRILYEPGDQVRTVYFPTGPGLVSFMVQLSDGKCVETALIGREGAVGGIVSQGRLPAYSRCLVQFPGVFLSVPSAALEEAKSESLTLRHLFARYADCVMAQIFQSVACNAGHPIEQRAAKWLVAAIERTGLHEVPLTQEQLAGMLGIGRSYISQVIGTFRGQSILETRRGGVIIKDVDQLRAIACDCNEQVKQHFDDVLRGVYPHEEEHADTARA